MGVHCAARRARDGGGVHYACGLWRMRGAPFRPGASSRLDMRCVCLAGAVGCIARAVQATDGGVGKCAPCRRGSSPAPASAKNNGRLDRIEGLWVAEKCGIKAVGPLVRDAP